MGQEKHWKVLGCYRGSIASFVDIFIPGMHGASRNVKTGWLTLGSAGFTQANTHPDHTNISTERQRLFAANL